VRRAIAEVLRDETFDLIHVENASMAQYVELFPPGVPAVLVDHEAGGSGEEPQRWAAYVQSFYPRFRRVVCLSEGDALHLRSLVPGLEVRVRPPGIVIPDAIVRRPQPDRVLFFGSPDHLPNRDALQWMGTEILPALQRRRPEARILCAGFDPAETSGASALRKSGLQLLGFVDDLDAELAQASIVLSPVRQGRGIRIKNLETLAHGVPLLTTPLGRRGLEDLPADALAVAEDTESLATRAAELLEDPTGTEAMGARGRLAVRDLFTFDHQATATREVWNELVSGA
jgi:glycosyltransferase involved in cell wall biosynthesis